MGKVGADVQHRSSGDRNCKHIFSTDLLQPFNIRITSEDGWHFMQAYCFLDVWCCCLCCLFVMHCYDTSFATVLSFELKVLKVDGAYVAVKFPGTSSSVSSQSAAPTDSDPSSLLQDCRLLRIDELQVKAHTGRNLAICWNIDW